MPAQTLLHSILFAAILLAGNSFPAYAADCEAGLMTLAASVVAEEPRLAPARVRIMPFMQPSYIFVNGANQKLIAWPDERDPKLNVSFLESSSENVFSVPLQAGEVIHGYDGDGNPDHLRVETDRRIFTLEFKR